MCHALSVWSWRRLKSNFMPILLALWSMSTRPIMIHLQMLIADWLTVLISVVIMINKTAHERDANKGDFLTEIQHLKKWKSGLFIEDRVFILLQGEVGGDGSKACCRLHKSFHNSPWFQLHVFDRNNLKHQFQTFVRLVIHLKQYCVFTAPYEQFHQWVILPL